MGYQELSKASEFVPWSRLTHGGTRSMKTKQRSRRSTKPSIKKSTRDSVHLKANRCPYCHDRVEIDKSIVCQQCLTRHHDACWVEGGHCSSCGCGNALSLIKEPEAVPTIEQLVGREPMLLRRFLAFFYGASTLLFLALAVALFPKALLRLAQDGWSVFLLLMVTELFIWGLVVICARLCKVRLKQPSVLLT